MKNVMTFPGGYHAVISYDPEIEMFRGEFIGLNGGADFYAADAASLKREGEISLKVFLEMCEKDGVQPKKTQSNFALRLPPDVYSQAAVAAYSKGISLNSFITEAVKVAAGM